MLMPVPTSMSALRCWRFRGAGPSPFCANTPLCEVIKGLILLRPALSKVNLRLPVCAEFPQRFAPLILLSNSNTSRPPSLPSWQGTSRRQAARSEMKHWLICFPFR